MLIEIKSDKFRDKKVSFEPGLNVVLGDDNATNSIGKSSMLMVVDFAYGGSSLIDHNSDIISELGHHDYYFTFQFNDDDFRFRRGTEEPDLVYLCDEGYVIIEPIELEKYWSFLKASFAVDINNISFRALVGLYSRVWGKENLEVYKPLHTVHQQSNKECINNLIKTFDKYGSIKSLDDELKELESEKSALSKAFRKEIIPKIGKRGYSENEKRISVIEDEIEDIKSNLATYAVNIAEISNREVIELKVEKDKLLSEELKLQNKLSRIKQNIAENRHIKSKNFESLDYYFPDIDKNKIAQVEEFHSKLAVILRSELRVSERDLESQILRIREEIGSIDSKLRMTLSSLDEPSVIVDRVFDLSSDLTEAKEENRFYDENKEIGEATKSTKSNLSEEKFKIVKLIEQLINNEISKIVNDTFSKNKKSPSFHLNENNYSYDVFEDTGTGTAYSSLIVFDLAIFNLTLLPTITHDSVLFKNIENDTVSNLISIYANNDKQSYIAIDEVDKYGKETAKSLRDNSVVTLNDQHVLYIKDWRTY